MLEIMGAPPNYIGFRKTAEGYYQPIKVDGDGCVYTINTDTISMARLGDWMSRDSWTICKESELSSLGKSLKPNLSKFEWVSGVTTTASQQVRGPSDGGNTSQGSKSITPTPAKPAKRH